GGGDGADHSIVVASHGLSPTFSPFRMLQKKLKMKGIWKSARIHAPQDEMTFRWRTGCANAYLAPPPNRRREAPASPTTNNGRKTRFIQTNPANKRHFPSIS